LKLRECYNFDTSFYERRASHELAAK
jgi:hypothetical protein